MAALIIFSVLVYLVIDLDSVPPKWDEAVHLRDSFVYYNILSDPSQLNLNVIKEIINRSENYPLLRPSGYYPPLVPLTSAFLFLLSGVSAKTAIMTNIIFMIIMTITVKKIGELIFNEDVGLLAAILILTFPVILQHSVIYYIDLPLTALTSLGIYTLLKTDFFTNYRGSIVFGICFGLGMLTKWTYIFFLIGPLLYSIFVMIQNRPDKRGSNSSNGVRNFLLFSLAALITFGVYYIPIISQLIKETLKYSSGPLTHGPASVFSIESLGFYIIALWENMVTPPDVMLTAAGIVLFLRSGNKHKLLMVIWLAVPYLIFTFLIQTKAMRFMMPSLIPMALIIAYAVITVSQLNVFSREYNYGKFLIALILVVFGAGFISEYSILRNEIITDSKEDWKVNEIITVVKNEMMINYTFTGEPMYLAAIPDHEFINGQTLRYYAAMQKLPLNVIKLQDYSGNAEKKFALQFDKYDYILTKSRDNIVKPAFQQSVDNMNKYFHSRINNFKCLKTFREPDGSDVYLYKKLTLK